MTSFGKVDLASDSDSDDADYDPTKDGANKNLSEEEESGDDEGREDGHRSKGKSKGKQKKTKVTLDGFAEAFEKEKEELKEAREKKKVDDLWADFKSGTSSIKSKSASKPTGSNLGTWSSTVKSQVQKKQPVSKVKKPVSNVFDSIFGDVTKESSVKVDSNEEEKKPSGISSIIDSIFKERENRNGEEEDVKSHEPDHDQTIKITKVFDFAGESVEVTTEVSKDSHVAKKLLKSQEVKGDPTNLPVDSPSSSKRPGGLASIVSAIDGKKPKLGTLDKSKIDWDHFVKEEGIKEDLETFNKGKDGFVEKQLFLERADLRRFEIEKQIRAKTRKTFLK